MTGQSNGNLLLVGSATSTNLQGATGAWDTSFDNVTVVGHVIYNGVLHATNFTLAEDSLLKHSKNSTEDLFGLELNVLGDATIIGDIDASSLGYVRSLANPYNGYGPEGVNITWMVQVVVVMVV